MPEIIVKPLNKEVDLQVCIPVFEREEELLVLYDSISRSLDGLNYNIYFLLIKFIESLEQTIQSMYKFSYFNPMSNLCA